jgi:hypothetical protein
MLWLTFISLASQVVFALNKIPFMIGYKVSYFQLNHSHRLKFLDKVGKKKIEHLLNYRFWIYLFGASIN